MKPTQKDNYNIANTLLLIITLFAFIFTFIGEYFIAFGCLLAIALCLSIIDEIESGVY